MTGSVCEGWETGHSQKKKGRFLKYPLIQVKNGSRLFIERRRIPRMRKKLPREEERKGVYRTKTYQENYFSRLKFSTGQIA